jgi:putative sigma-54 modulation protein
MPRSAPSVTSAAGPRLAARKPSGRTTKGGNRVLIEYTGRHTEVGDDHRRLTEKKVGKLSKVLPGITRVHVILTVDKHREIAEVTVHSSHLDLAAIEESGDLAGSLASVIDKLTRQAQKRLGKLRERNRRSTLREAAVWTGIVHEQPVSGNGGEAPARARVVQSRRFVAKPMTVDEAVLAVNKSDDGLLIFRDAATERLSVLYRRKDGNLGLIEPEA